MTFRAKIVLTTVLILHIAMRQNVDFNVVEFWSPDASMFLTEQKIRKSEAIVALKSVKDGLQRKSIGEQLELAEMCKQC